MLLTAENNRCLKIHYRNCLTQCSSYIYSVSFANFTGIDKSDKLSHISLNNFYPGLTGNNYQHTFRSTTKPFVRQNVYYIEHHCGT